MHNVWRCWVGFKALDNLRNEDTVIMKRKDSIYQKYIGQLEETTKAGYHFEGAWLEYVLLEDRLVSLLENSGGVPNGIRMMGPKIGELKSRSINDSNLRGHLSPENLLDRLDNWKDQRNLLMHSMADGSLSVDEIESKIKTLAESGSLLVRQFASAARRVKRRAVK